MIKRIIKYCFISLMAATIFFYALTKTGYNKIYHTLMNICSFDITEIEKLMEDKETSEKIENAKIIVVAKTGHVEGDLSSALNMITLSDQMKLADVWVEQIPNSEAEQINRYLENAELFYLSDALYKTINQKNDNYRVIAERLYESYIVNNQIYTVAGIENETSLHQQLTNIRMLIEEAKNNPIRDELKQILENTDVSDKAYLDAIADSIRADETMYKEHFLTDYQTLQKAVCVYESYKAGGASMIEAFCELYEDNPAGTFILFMDGSEISKFMGGLSEKAAIFKKRYVLIEAFDYTDSENSPVEVRIVDSDKMKLADAYGRFVYSLSGSEFHPTERETERYYIRIENQKS